MPRRKIHIEMKDDYEGFWLDMWSNPPLRIFMEMQDTSDFDKLEQIIQMLIMDWNLVDFEGEPIPVGNLRDVGMDMIGIIVQSYMTGVQQSAEVPKSGGSPDRELDSGPEAEQQHADSATA